MTFYFQFPDGYFSEWFPAGATIASSPSGSPINRPTQFTRQVQRPDACCERVSRFVGTYTYTARNEESGAKATVTRQCESVLSEEHAKGLARILAKCEAEAEVR